jgi:hypothetical protein
MRLFLLVLLLLEVGLAKKVALVIGNSNYSKGYLANPINDAELIRDTLKNTLGFDVTYGTDLTKYKMKKLIKKFSLSIKKEDIALFYYSGHGVQYKHLNYLIPLEADAVTEGQIPSVGIDVNYILGGMERGKLAILLLDACRNNPFKSFNRGGNRGLAQIRLRQRNYIVSYATEAGDVARDGGGKNSPYALALKEFLPKPLEISRLLKKVKNSVAKATSYEQIPYVDDHYIGEYRLQKKSSCTKIIKTEAIYKSVAKRIKVKEKSVKKVPLLAQYKIKEKKIRTSESYIVYIWTDNGIKTRLEPKFKTVTKRVLVSYGKERYVVSKNRCKKVKMPPLYKSISIRKIVKDVDLSRVPISMHYKSFVVPAKYTVLKVSKMVIAPSCTEVITPAIFKTTTEDVLVTPEKQKSISVPCEDNI